MLTLFLIIFIDLVGFGIIIPLNPFYAQHFGATPDVVTLLMPTYSLAQFIFAPIWGRLSDRIGRRPVLLVTLIGTVIAYLVYAYAANLAMLFAARALAGIMAGNIGVAQAYMADITGPETRAKGMGLIGAAFGLGFILGPAIGGVLAGSEIGGLNFQLPAFAAAGASLVAFVMAFLLLKESHTERKLATERPGAGRRIGDLVEAVLKPQLGLLIVLFFCVTFVFAGMEATFALWSERQFGWGPAQNGYAFAFAGLVTALVQGGLIGPLTRRFGEARLVVHGAVALGLGLALIPFANDVLLVLVALALIAIGTGLGNPTLSSLISRHADPDRQGSILGVAQSASSLGRMTGPMCAGVVFAGMGRAWPYVFGALIMAAVVVIALRLVRAPTPVTAVSADGE